jgi:hypothetical protein
MKLPFLLIIASLLASSALQAFTPAELSHAGQDALDSFKPSLSEAPNEHGFNSKEEIQSLTLGGPLAVCQLNLDALPAYEEGRPITTILRAPQTWFFPVLLGTETRAVVSITILRDSHKLAPEAFGKAALAESIAPFVTQYGAENLVLVTGRHPLDLYIHVRSVARPNLSPITGDRPTTQIFVNQPAGALPVIESLRAK